MNEPSKSAKPVSNAPDPLIGRLLADRFLLQALIARGGMGKVYRAEQAPLGRQCAVKVLNPKYVGDHDPDFARRFFLEATIASKLTHPNTVTIFDYGQTDDGIFYMAMELLEGETLHRAIKTGAPFQATRVAHIGRQISRSLREAHAHGVIHRDLKPANVFLTEHGDEPDFVKVLDFGLVKNLEGPMEDLTETGLFMGSPKYMAPEAIRGEQVDARGDIYSLGVILYEMTCGKPPFDRANSLGTLMAHVNDQPPPLEVMCPGIEVPPELSATIFACLEKEPEHRLHTMEEVLIALKQIGPSGTHGMTGEFRSVQPPSVRVSVGTRSSHPPPSNSGQQIARDVAARLSRSSSRMAAARAVEAAEDLAPSDAETRAVDRDVTQEAQSAYEAHHRKAAAEADASAPREALHSGIATKIVAVEDPHHEGEPSAALPLVSQSRRAMHPAVWALAGGALVALIAALGVARRHHATAAAPSDTSPVASVPAAPPSPTPSASPVVEHDTVPTVTVNALPSVAAVAPVLHLTSTPTGALVRELDGVDLCTKTPCDVTFRADEPPGTVHKLTAMLGGFASSVTTVHATDGTVNLRLGSRTWPDPPKKKPTPTPTSPGAANGFKDIPY